MEFSLEKNVRLYFTFNSQIWNGKTKEWEYPRDPHFYITELLDGDSRLGQKIFINIAGKWIHTKKHPGRSVYMHDLDFQTTLKCVDLNHLAEACAVLTEKTGCRVEHTQYTIVKENDIKVPKNEDDLMVIHPDAQIVARGTKLHEGWDIGDPWAVVRTRKGNLIIYYSTNGHGFGYDTVINPDKSVTDFYYWLVGKEVSKLQSFIPANVLKKLDERGP